MLHLNKLEVQGPGAAFVADKINDGILIIDPESEKGNLGLSRDQMPQLDEDTTWRFIKDLQKVGVATTAEDMLVAELRATQSEISTEKIASILKEISCGKKTVRELGKKIIISNDNYILDGHHRWAALLIHDPQNTMSCLKVDLKMKKLLRIAKSYAGVTSESL